MINNFMNVKEAAVFLGYTDRNITTLCSAGKLVGAFKEGLMWFIPEETVRIYKMAHPRPKNEKKLVEASIDDGDAMQSLKEAVTA